MTFIEHYEKNAVHTDKGTTHSYICWFYSGQFETRRHEALKIVEIGVETGDSLVIWAGWMPNAIVTGIDTVNRKYAFTQPNIRFIAADGYARETAERFEDNSLDYVIDDGLHTLESQIRCVEFWMPKLKSGGKLVIEDVQDIDAARLEFNKLSIPCVILDLRQNKGRYDDVLFCLTKLS
jgi:Methyltransferase domain